MGIKWMALLAEEQKCRLPLLLSLSLSLNGSIIEGQWERDSDLEFSVVTFELWSEEEKSDDEIEFARCIGTSHAPDQDGPFPVK